MAFRWLQHHSVLTPADGIILGASSKPQLVQNLEDCLKGPLDEDVVTALDEARRIVVAHGGTPRYWR
jgi:aflatoxin B1 aldehyde reductase